MWLDDGRSLAICAVEVDPRDQGVAVLEPGSRVVLYSDGLVERRGRDMGDGMEELARSAAEHRHAPASELPGLLMRLAPTPSDDDIVVLCLGWQG